MSLRLGHPSVRLLLTGYKTAVSDPAGSASIGVREDARVAIYLDLAPGEVVSTFEATFELVSHTLDVDSEFAIGCEVGMGDWGAVACLYAESGEKASNIAISLTSENAGDERIVLKIHVASLGVPGLLEIFVRDPLIYFDSDTPPYFGELSLDEGDGALLSSIAVPEPTATALQLIALGTALLLRRRQALYPC